MTATLTRPLPARTVRTTRRLLPEGWPLLLLLVGMPLWWALGMGSLIWSLAAIPMAAWLWAQPKVRVPKGFGLWLLFLAWVVASGTQLASPDRFVSFTYRLALYASAGIYLVYAYNLPRHLLPVQRLAGLLTAYWALIVAGGYAALAFPYFSATSLTERLLPSSLATHPFVAELVHLQFARISIILDYPVARPTAPFAYTNEWGSTLAILTPIAILWIMLRGRGWLRTLAILTLFAAIVPAVSSLNRGMWLSLGVTLAYAALRLALSGRVRPLQTLVVMVVIGAGIFVLTPLQEVVTDRLATPHSNEARMSMYEGAAEGAARSPLLGNGTTRPVDDRKPESHQIGTHGQLWLVMFSHGVPALLFFLGWLLVLLWRTRSAELSGSFFFHLCIFAAVVQLPYYSLIPAQIHVIMLVGAVALRDVGLGGPRVERRTRTTLAGIGA